MRRCPHAHSAAHSYRDRHLDISPHAHPHLCPDPQRHPHPDCHGHHHPHWHWHRHPPAHWDPDHDIPASGPPRPLRATERDLPHGWPEQLLRQQPYEPCRRLGDHRRDLWQPCDGPGRASRCHPDPRGAEPCEPPAPGPRGHHSHPCGEWRCLGPRLFEHMVQRRRIWQGRNVGANCFPVHCVRPVHPVLQAKGTKRILCHGV
mmetsp:Transcript_55965/g.99640  ORF Transcript_55965/g.99640 Transcript_55965/m.99640 type:complete len:203 (+) Transcript_55965:318-926(+)